jgi:hypothetical protein
LELSLNGFLGPHSDREIKICNDRKKKSVRVWLFFAMERFWDGWDELENYMQ